MTKAPETILVNLDSNDDGCCPVEVDDNGPLDDEYGEFFDYVTATPYTRTDLFTAMQAERDDMEYEAHAHIEMWGDALKERDEARRRRDEWRKKAEGFEALQSAVRSGIDEAGDRNLSRVFLRGALVVSEKERDAAIARAEKAEAALQWQPIETAPKDGRMVLIRTESGDEWTGTFAAYWSASRQAFFYSQDRSVPNATHWMPLPPPPETP